MGIRQQLKGFVLAFRSTKGKATSHSGHSLAVTLRHSSHSRGSMGLSGADYHHRLVGEGHANFTASFAD